MIYTDTTRLAYRPADLRSSIRSDDFWQFDLSKDMISEAVEDIARSFALSNSAVRDIGVRYLRGKQIFTTDSLYDTITVRRTDQILRRSIAASMFSREDEITQLVNIIKSEEHATLFRTDISDFFESIRFRPLLSKLQSDGFSNKTTLAHLTNIRKRVHALGCPGLPRGLSISSTLAEFYMADFDREMRLMADCLYYCRYVDDIFAIVAKDTNDIRKRVESILPQGLTLNAEKTVICSIGEPRSIEYLGYSISLDGEHRIKVALTKISKTKRRIILSLRRFVKDSDFTLLLERIKFLASNTLMDIKGRDNAVCAGFKFQYSLCDQDQLASQLKQLDTFLRAVLFSKRYYLGRRARNMMTLSQLAILCKISFLAGFRESMIQRLPREKIAQIRRAWLYE